jgi:pyruvate formate lyase activating enzyme
VDHLEVLTGSRLSAVAIDPIEKKPLAHFRPGSTTFSIAQAGCNLVCPFCQNHGLSQSLRSGAAAALSGEPWSPERIVEAAGRHGCASISFTYSEPVLSFELARDVAALARPAGVDLVFVTNGQINTGPARELAAMLAAANVDLKCHDEGSYRRVLGGSLEATLEAIRILAAGGVWIELTTLVIPGFNDGDAELARIAEFIAGVDPAIPWHVSRFHPDHEWSDRPFTPAATLRRAAAAGARAGLKHVYLGNLPGHEGEHTHCPSCGRIAIERSGYLVARMDIEDGRCRTCGGVIAGVGLP